MIADRKLPGYGDRFDEAVRNFANVETWGTGFSLCPFVSKKDSRQGGPSPAAEKMAAAGLPLLEGEAQTSEI